LQDVGSETVSRWSTWGDVSGWHPHYHVLLIHDQDLGAAAITALHGHIHSRLAASCRN
jgi:hypothetical protein